MSSLDTAHLLNSSKWLSKALFQESSPRFRHLNDQAVCMEKLTGSRGGHTRLIQKTKPSTIPGAVVSIDQLESPVPGFMPIAKGQPTVQKYHSASVFVDHASDFTYIHMHYHLTTDKTIDAKHVFECLTEQHGVRILHYH